uniref:Uncharacterized protein n=1 Tax=Megaselia scalaris TaxID=36166 RepID=T1GTY7_MEGSC
MCFKKFFWDAIRTSSFVFFCLWIAVRWGEGTTLPTVSAPFFETSVALSCLNSLFENILLLKELGLEDTVKYFLKDILSNGPFIRHLIVWTFYRKLILDPHKDEQNTWSCVKAAGGVSEKFQTLRGFAQGDALSCSLFNTWLLKSILRNRNPLPSSLNQSSHFSPGTRPSIAQKFINIFTSQPSHLNPRILK